MKIVKIYSKTLFIISLLLFFNLFAEAKGTKTAITGTIKSTNGESLSYVSVHIKGTDSGCMSDTDGNFSLEVTQQKSELVFSMLGYETTLVNVDLSNKQALEVTMKEDTNLLSEVNIVGKTEAGKLKEKGFAINVIEMQKFAVQSVQTNELLDRTAGVRTRQDGGLGSKVNYNINGLSGNAIKIFIDGVPASNYGSSFSLNSIPPALIERVEVYKGVVPGYLSEDALGGAINIVLKQRRKNSLTTSYSFGSFNTHQWNVTGNYRMKNGLSFDASAFYNYSDNNYKVWGEEIRFENFKGNVIETHGKIKVKRFHDAYESFGGRFNIGFTDVKWADRFFLGTVLSKNYKEIQHGETMEIVYGDRHRRYNSNVLTLSYEKKKLFTEGLSFKLDASLSNLKRQVIDTVGNQYGWQGAIKDSIGNYIKTNSGAEAGKDKTAEINKELTHVIRVNLGYAINNNHAFYFNFLFNNFERKVSDKYLAIGLQRLQNTFDLQKNILSFTYENIAFSERLRTNLFYKHYFQTVTSNEPYLVKDVVAEYYDIKRNHKKIDYSGYGISFSFALFPQLFIIGSAEKTIRMPTAEELFGNNAESLVAPKDPLNPERSNNFNIGLNYGSLVIGKHSINLNTTFYYRDTKDMIRKNIDGNTGGSNFSFFENIDKVLTKGIDGELTYNYGDKLKFLFNISKLSSVYNTTHNKLGAPFEYYRMQLRNEPTFKYNANITYYLNNLVQKGSKISIYYNINYVNKFRRNWGNVGGTNFQFIKRQFPMDIGCIYTLPSNKIVISLNAKNILDQRVVDNYGLQKPGRSFYVKLTYFIL